MIARGRRPRRAFARMSAAPESGLYHATERDGILREGMMGRWTAHRRG